MNKNVESVLCAAIWYNDGKEYLYMPINIESGIVVSGYRHPSCFTLLKEIFPNRDYILDGKGTKTIQGFVTSKNRFVDRIEGAKIAFKSKQIEKLKYSDKELYSEDLY